MTTLSKRPCRCHSSELYRGLVECPACGHNSLDRLPGWEGCERRACGYQRTIKSESGPMTEEVRNG